MEIGLVKRIELDHVTLAVDEVGDQSGPPVLLIAGATQSMDWWPPDFCETLAADGLHVIRYDQRDTGESTASPPGHPSYTGGDLATDPLRIMDRLGISAAHLVGVSMGGGIAQYLGVHAADRVLSLTLIESSPAGGGTDDLPPPEAAVAEDATPEPEDWSDTSAVIDYRVEAERPYAGSLGFDDARFRAIATREAGRSRDMAASMVNHFLLAADAGADPSLITAPTLIVHSDSDPLFPLAHGEALARIIPNATLLRVHGMGHEVPPPRVWNVVVPALVEHVRAASAIVPESGDVSGRFRQWPREDADSPPRAPGTSGCSG
ncbi:alpha/beta fold hydrolase [Zhihengliuella halotolerans]|uniref:Pimeloyl-ACP methyl ester carboxylesterase n=1 Tax=Zhihengliuella halotolerans TaxID=370736 RepID=A0A4Q8AA43_9MICC|nr:alpha/beta hydrolase [Zhihengliuella halotolerans]RZU60967.1 pimeloyl-ACP methyl ester carboxylesterase [Zhihengliuella halotolerans]